MFYLPAMGGILGRYIARQTVSWLLVGLLGASFVFLSTQLVRVAPIFTGAKVNLQTMVEAFLLLMVPIAGWALAPAFLIALFAVAGGMSENGELDALDALGIPKFTRLAGTATLALFLTGVNAWIWIDVAPRAQRRLFAIAANLAEEALIGQLTPGQVRQPFQGLTFYAGAKSRATEYNDIFIEWNDGSNTTYQVVSEKAQLGRSNSEQTLAFKFLNGHLFALPLAENGEQNATTIPRTAVSFETLTIPLPISEAIRKRIDFMPWYLTVDTGKLLSPPPPGIEPTVWEYTFWRRVAAPPGFLVLVLSGLLLAFGTAWKSRGRAVLTATLLFVVFHGAGRFGESLMSGGHVPPGVAAFLPLVAIVVPVVVALSVLLVTGRLVRAHTRHLAVHR